MKNYKIKIVPKTSTGIMDYTVEVRAADRVTAQNIALRHIGKAVPCRLHDSERGKA